VMGGGVWLELKKEEGLLCKGGVLRDLKICYEKEN